MSALKTRKEGEKNKTKNIKKGEILIFEHLNRMVNFMYMAVALSFLPPSFASEIFVVKIVVIGSGFPLPVTSFVCLPAAHTLLLHLYI